MLSDQHIEEFLETGIVVIENVLTPDEIFEARNNFHNQLLTLGINHDAILNSNEKSDGKSRLKSPVSRLFYAKWKLLDIHLHPNVCQAMDELLRATYSSGATPGFIHPFGPSTTNLCYVDRVCWRLPDRIQHEGGLDLHLDRNPINPYFDGLMKFRPIQAFVALTDHYGPESGGLKVVKGFHKILDDYFSQVTESTSTGGEFYRFNSKSHVKLAKKCETIYAPKGSLVCWDNRLPHATCDKLSGFDSREVVYTGFLPDVEINRRYVQQQAISIRQNIPPPAYMGSGEQCDKDWTLLSVDQARRLMMSD